MRVTVASDLPITAKYSTYFFINEASAAAGSVFFEAQYAEYWCISRIYESTVVVDAFFSLTRYSLKASHISAILHLLKKFNILL